jgi:twinkle protein
MFKDFKSFGIELNNRIGAEVKVPCPRCSSQRKKKNYPCLNVNTEKGIWNCWHCGWSGGLKTGEYSKPTVAHTRTYYKPDFKPEPLNSKTFEFLATRGLTKDVLIRNHVTTATVWMPQVEEEVRALAFPYYRDGEVVNIKYRDTKKNFRQVGGARKTFYKIDDVTDTAIITEGEIDALSLEVAGFKNGISVPDGAPAANSKNYETKFEYLDDEKLDSIKTFILAVDNDEPGRKLEEELARRLGRDRCLRVTWVEGCKDANEVLLAHGVEVLVGCINNAQSFPVEGVFSVYDIAEDLRTLFEDGLPTGASTGWANIDELYSPTPSQWTLVTGIPSMGKSEWLDALAINLAEKSGWIIGACSPENQPITWHTSKIMEKHVGKRLRHMSREEFESSMDWCNQHFHFILPEEPTIEAVLVRAKELVQRFGMRGLIIDPYNELDHTKRKEGINETEYISMFLTYIRKFAREQGVHVWLVAHPSKPTKDRDGKYPVPDGYSVSGSAHFYNKADNIITVHRDITNPKAPTEIHVQKVRSRWLGKQGVGELWWKPDSGRYVFENIFQPTGKDYASGVKRYVEAINFGS